MTGWLSNVARGIFLPFPQTVGAVTPGPTLSITPGRLNPSAAQTVTWIGSNTRWLTTAPNFSATGPSIAVGSVTVDSNTQAHATVTTTTERGTLTWTDSTTAATCTMTIAPRRLLWVPRRRYR
jgi:hypothetical protein